MQYLSYIALGILGLIGYAIFMRQMLELDNDLVRMKATEEEAATIQGRFYKVSFGVLFMILGVLLLIWTIAREFESLKSYLIP